MLLLISDLDDTLVSQTESLVADKDLDNFNTIWKNQLLPQNSRLVYNTGRSVALFYELFNKKQLLLPDYLICGVGTEVYSFTPDSKLEKLQQWTDIVLEDFRLEHVKLVTQQWISSGLLRLQMEYIETKIVPNLKASLVSVNIIVSVQHGVGHLDILPVKANKGTAAMWLREYLGFPPQLTMVCGESMNDYDMFFSSSPQVLRVAVGNCEENVRKKFLQLSKVDNHFYLASRHFAGVVVVVKKMSVGIPIKLLHEAISQTVTVETKSGDLYRGTLYDAEDNMNCQLKKVTCTGRDGKITPFEHVFLRGSKIRFFIVPDILANAPMFKRVEAIKEGKTGRGLGLGRGRGFIGGPVKATIRARIKRQRTT
ncbi:Probable sucrose-phosphatase 1 [Galdieria sulphuraria]|nr:Probable sucrose-phosphatase 1 [Galdieria sulphuraria]